MNVSLSARHFAVTAVLVLLTGAAVTACGSTVTDVRAGSRIDPGPSTDAAAAPVPYCPAPEAGPAPSPCISYGDAQRYADNHAYAREMPLPDAVRSAAAPAVQALRTALQGLVGAPLTEPVLRAAAAGAAGVRPEAVHVALDAAGGRASVVVSTASGCLHGAVAEGRATAEVTGFIADGGCVPAVGH